MNNKTTLIVPVILAGGAGTRLWPMSREAYPKQFLTFGTTSSLLQKTWLRIADIADIAPIIVANEEHRFIVSEQMREIGVSPSALILEPIGRNTAPALAVAALKARESGVDPVLLVLPSDHGIVDSSAFLDAVKKAQAAAEAGKLVTFGIKPSRPETGYGYIKYAGGNDIQQVQQFVEKPDFPRAQAYFKDSSYLWNSGIFLFKVSTLLDEMQLFQPDILSVCTKALTNSKTDLDFIRRDRTTFEQCPSLSIDYAVMEKTENASVLCVDVGWSDLGSWDSLGEILSPDHDGNFTSGNVTTQDCTNTLVFGESRLLVTIGLSDTLVIDTPDALLVANKSRSQQIKQVVESLKSAQKPEALEHTKVYRPWGTYELISKGEKFVVKKISVKPGASLSMQKHLHRSEHWIVVAGEAQVTVDGSQRNLQANESTYIPVGVKHRLANNTKDPLELIEIQSGDYLSEDDIVRFDDNYGRSHNNV